MFLEERKREKHERLQPCYSRRGSNVPDNDYEYKYVKSSALYFFFPSLCFPSIFYWAAHYVRHLSLLMRHLHFSYMPRPPCWIMFIIGARTFSRFFLLLIFRLHHPTITHTHTLVGIFWKWDVETFVAMKHFPFARMSWGYQKIINGFSVHDNIEFFSPSYVLMDLLLKFFLSSLFLFPWWPKLMIWWWYDAHNLRAREYKVKYKRSHLADYRGRLPLPPMRRKICIV